MATKVVQQGTVSVKLIGRWEQVCQKLAAFAEEVPENKFDYRPVQVVRTFADVRRHVAFWMWQILRAGEKAPTRLRNFRGTDIRPKRESSTARPEPEMADMVVTFIEHRCEHYRQLAVYARLNQIVPPAARG